VTRLGPAPALTRHRNIPSLHRTCDERGLTGRGHGAWYQLVVLIVQRSGADHATFPSERSHTRAARTRALFSTSNPTALLPHTPTATLPSSPRFPSPSTVVWDTTEGRTARVREQGASGMGTGNSKSGHLASYRSAGSSGDHEGESPTLMDNR